MTIEDIPAFANQSPSSVVNEPSLSQSEEAPNLMGPCDPSSAGAAGEKTISDIDSMPTEYKLSNEKEFFQHQVQTAWQHYLMAVMDMTNMESGVHAPARIEDDAVDMLKIGGGDWSLEDGASEFSGYSTSSTLAMGSQGTEWTPPPAEKDASSLALHFCWTAGCRMDSTTSQEKDASSLTLLLEVWRINGILHQLNLGHDTSGCRMDTSLLALNLCWKLKRFHKGDHQPLHQAYGMFINM